MGACRLASACSLSLAWVEFSFVSLSLVPLEATDAGAKTEGEEATKEESNFCGTNSIWSLLFLFPFLLELNLTLDWTRPAYF